MSLSDRMAVGMALALLLLPFLPASGILLQVGFVIAERLALHATVEWSPLMHDLL